MNSISTLVHARMWIFMWLWRVCRAFHCKKRHDDGGRPLVLVSKLGFEPETTSCDIHLIGPIMHELHMPIATKGPFTRRTLTPPPYELFGGGRFGQGQPSERNPDFLDLTENFCPPARLWKNHCSCIFEGHLSTNPILNALHLQGSKFNIFFHFH